MREAFKSKGV